ncbi:hypothetical protein GDO81_014677 [Engystomops pustulosus]|uniref:TIL domain-containing protein n=1 Tax=Engystomops pustulosus TaxID=76066 RepID=A0AAV7BBV7_ENGPU|nr:hypothetical protein GDO81_014677 [Engystomops pustulosus]KAG8570069.1 hypothetical protein GDO81_014677 [Engystomops pustulosus]KAG8570070.1 hypothetical protein GDO81_014677 [Engystomops pustulosus]
MMSLTTVLLLSPLSLLLMMVTAQDVTTPPREEDKEFSECGGQCPPTCDNFFPVCKCTPGYVCKFGTAADKTGKCVKYEDCCIANNTYSTCGDACGRYCEKPQEPDIRCILRDCYIGCFCLPGYVYEEYGSFRCILPEDCPKY